MLSLRPILPIYFDSRAIDGVRERERERGGIYLGRVLEHFGMLGDETHADAGPVHFRGAAGMREDGRASKRGALHFLRARVPGYREILAFGVQLQRWQRRPVNQAATTEPRTVRETEKETKQERRATCAQIVCSPQFLSSKPGL